MIIIPDQLSAACRGVPERMAWLEQLPRVIQELQTRWSLSFGPPWSTEASCSWVAPALRSDGTRVVLKLGMPHMEAAHELEGLRFWNGDPTVRLLDADAERHALLLERCEPGSTLRDLPELEQDVVIADLLHRLWRKPSAPHLFRPLSVMVTHWRNETMTHCRRWIDPDLVEAGLRIFEELLATSSEEMLLATDLHAGNVLRAERSTWLVIDPKPFIGDPAYDATQHLLNCTGRLLASPYATVRRFANLLDVDEERVRWWLFARSAAEPRDNWTDESSAIARALV